MTPTPPRPLLTVVEVPLADLRPDPDNPRRITAKRRAILEQQVADDSFMRARPVIALPDGLIVAGEQRWRARAKIGRETCFAFFADLDDAERVEWAARDNNHAGEWVGDALGELLGDERRPDRLALMGFTLDDVDKLVRPAKRDRGSAAGSDDLPDLPEEPETRPGDVIELGAHRLICGDATKDGVLDRLLARGASGPGAARVDAVITDPPYAIYGSSTGLAAEVADDKMVRPFFRAALQATARALKPFGHVYVCCDWRSWASWWEVAKGTGITPKNMIVWDKKGSGLGNNYANTHELIFFACAIPKRTRMTVDNPVSAPYSTRTSGTSTACRRARTGSTTRRSPSSSSSARSTTRPTAASASSTCSRARVRRSSPPRTRAASRSPSRSTRRGAMPRSRDTRS